METKAFTNLYVSYMTKKLNVIIIPGLSVDLFCVSIGGTSNESISQVESHYTDAYFNKLLEINVNWYLN